jgi:hypothetical protein
LGKPPLIRKFGVVPAEVEKWVEGVDEVKRVRTGAPLNPPPDIKVLSPLKLAIPDIELLLELFELVGIKGFESVGVPTVSITTFKLL